MTLGDVDDIRLRIVARASAAFAAEIDRHDPREPIRSALWGSVASMVDHLGRIYLWVGEIVRTGARVDRDSLTGAPSSGLRAWFEDCRRDMLRALDETPTDRTCWTVGADPAGTAAFWRRRMIYETAKHLMDVRSAGGSDWVPAPELAPYDYADGIDELLEVFLRRSRPDLDPLPAPIALVATDIARVWGFTTDWTVSDDVPAGATCLTATAADLALVLWERADPSAAPGRFTIDGEQAVVNALTGAAIHP